MLALTDQSIWQDSFHTYANIYHDTYTQTLVVWVVVWDLCGLALESYPLKFHCGSLKHSNRHPSEVNGYECGDVSNDDCWLTLFSCINPWKLNVNTHGYQRDGGLEHSFNIFINSISMLNISMVYGFQPAIHLSPWKFKTTETEMDVW